MRRSTSTFVASIRVLAPRGTLIVFIDDATTRLTELRFAPVEPTRAYLETLRDQVLEHGRPLAFYSDRHPGSAG